MSQAPFVLGDVMEHALLIYVITSSHVKPSRRLYVPCITLLLCRNRDIQFRGRPGITSMTGSHQTRHLGDKTSQSNATAVLNPRNPSGWMRETKKGKGMK